MRFICAVVAIIIALTALGFTEASAIQTDTAPLITDFTLLCDGAEEAALTDDSIYTYFAATDISITSNEDVYGLYIKFDREPEPWRLCADGQYSDEGEERYLHQFTELNGCRELSLHFRENTVVADIYLFGKGEIPDWVNVWETAALADIMICPTHSDDDQLFFAGMLPWCAANGYTVQVVYLTNHLNTHDRPHELLEGIWHCGVKYYPYVSDFPDLYALSLEEAKANYETYGYTFSDFVDFYMKALERFKPLVVAGHDINGEYGHGVHMLSFHALTAAVEQSAACGSWDVPKTYIHLWTENETVFNWDEPLEYFDGKTAFEISQEGYGFHKSQHRFTSLSNWLYGTEAYPREKASQIGVNSPCRFGLYRSTVGTDTVENGLFEHLTSYGEAEKIRANEAAMLKRAVFKLGERRLLSDSAVFSPLSEALPIPHKATLPAEETTDALTTEDCDVSVSTAKDSPQENFEVDTLILCLAAAVLILLASRKAIKALKGRNINVENKE